MKREKIGVLATLVLFYYLLHINGKLKEKVKTNLIHFIIRAA